MRWRRRKTVTRTCRTCGTSWEVNRHLAHLGRHPHVKRVRVQADPHRLSSISRNERILAQTEANLESEGQTAAFRGEVEELEESARHCPKCGATDFDQH